MLRPLIRATAPGLLEVYGVGFNTAAKLLVAVGDNSQRIRSEAAFAHLCGVAPIPASSGKTIRHRLNRGGNRQANSALFHIVLTRMKHHQPTRDYVARRLAEGKTMGEIARILERYVACEVFNVTSKRLGHASVRTTYDGYGHLFEGRDREAANALDVARRRSLADSWRIRGRRAAHLKRQKPLQRNEH